MTEATVDLDAYFHRVGYAGPRAPTPEVLAALQKHHMHAIPFENLDVLLQRPIRLDPEALQSKLIARRRGGYCFESNGLFMHVLRAMGFQTTALSARVLFDRPELPLPPRSHMLQRVDFDDGAVIVDVAFGGLTPAGLLRCEPNVAQSTRRESCRLVPVGDESDVQALLGNRWTTLYRFATHPHLPVDFEQPNWHVSTHPESYFVNNLIVAIPSENCRYTLFNDVFRTRHPDGRVDERAVASGQELVTLLKNTFMIELDEPDRERIARRLPV